jgi:hypothetical protein
MTDHDNTDDAGEMVDFDAEITALLGDPVMWDQPSDGLGDHIASAIQSEARLDAPTPIVAGSVGSRRPWLRPALLGAAAAIVFTLGGVVVLSALSGVDDRETFSSALTPTGLIADVGGDVQIVAFDSGLRIDLDAPSLPRRANGLFYQGWLKTIDGHLIPIGTFHGGEQVTMWAGVDLDDVELFTITLEAAVASGDDIGQGSSGEVVLRTAVNG